MSGIRGRQWGSLGLEVIVVFRAFLSTFRGVWFDVGEEDRGEDRGIGGKEGGLYGFVLIMPTLLGRCRQC